MALRTIGTSGADHVDINAWVLWVQTLGPGTTGTLTADVTGGVMAVGVTSSTQQVISGWAPGGFTTLLTSNTNDSFSENANRQTNALFYATANGAFYTSTYSASAGMISLQVEKSRITKLQIKATGGYTRVLDVSVTTIADCIIEGNILHATNCDSGALELSAAVTGITIRNNLIINDRGAANSCAISTSGACTTTPAKIHDNTLWNAATVTGMVQMGGVDTAEFIGNCFTNNTTCAINGRDANVSGSNNATPKSAWDGTSYGAFNLTHLGSGQQMSIVVANELIDADSGPTDFRLKSGGTQLQDTNIAITGITTDIVGTTRPQGTIEDIGCWEFVVAALMAQCIF